MNKIKLIVDSTVDLTKELYEENDMEVIPFDVNFNEENFKDGIDIDVAKVYEKVKEYGELPHTAAASLMAFEDAFKKWVDKGYDVIYVGIGSLLSSAFNNVRIAAGDMLDKNVFLVDSKSLSSGSGLLALKIAKYIKEGKRSAKEIVEIIQPMADKVVAQFTVYTLDYLRKGGRCSGAAAVVGNLLHIHPYLRVVDGKLIVYKKVRGPMKIALKEQLNDLISALPNVDMDNIMVTHTGMPEGLNDFVKEEVEKLVGKGIVKETTAGAVIGSHCGFGTLGILYIKK